MEKCSNMGNEKFSDTTSSSLHIGGISVKFPVKPYPSQLSMMSRIIGGLEQKQHCLLESPTGSGKSLALLCSAIAWQQTQREKLDDDVIARLKSCSEYLNLKCTCQPDKQSKTASTTDTSKYFDNNADKDKSTVDFCSDSEDDDFRPQKKPSSTTQSEPKQPCEKCQRMKDEEYKLVKEEGYKKPRVPKIWFGTRTHKQIAQITKELKRTAYKSTRMTILSSRQHSCIHPAVMKSSNKNEECKELRSGLHSSGATCAFYHNVHRMKNHYQLDCAGMNHAWDLEELVGLGKTIKACPFYSARELITSSDIIFCPYNYLIDPLIRSQMQINPNNQIIIMDEAHNIEDSARTAGSFTMTEESLANTTADLQFLISDGVKLDDHRPLHLLCSKLGQWIGEHSRYLKSSEYETSSDVWHGRDIVNHLKEWGITQDTLPLLQNNYSAAIDIGEEHPEEAKVLHSSSQAMLGGLFNVLRYLMNEDNKYCDDYRITILRQAVFKAPPPKRTRDGWIELHKKSKKRFEMTLNFWCLNPSVAFGDLKQAHCIILTSGTLSPMSSFSSELGLSFPIQLEANHVIKDSQVWVGAIGCGPKGIELEATYKNTDRFDFQDELGEVVLQVCKDVPHGILCFFSSYGMLQKMQQRWQSTGLWNKLEEIKCVICEPRSSNKEEFESLLNSFYEAIKMSEDGNTGGSLMFAVCRGKVSEGLDFADNNARAVITVGIPFPSIKDKQVELKRKYNDMHKRQRGLLSGGQWYEIQAFRAMNQALGRCIRHRSDWGALIIVDQRFCKNPIKYSKGLSKWVRQKMNPYPVYENARTNLQAFIQKWQSINSHQEDQSLEESIKAIPESETTLPEPSLSERDSTIIENSGPTLQTDISHFNEHSPNGEIFRPAPSVNASSLKKQLNPPTFEPHPLEFALNIGEDTESRAHITEAGASNNVPVHKFHNSCCVGISGDTLDEDFTYDTIAASPDGDITIIPESPTSETKVPFRNVEFKSEQVRQHLAFSGPTENLSSVDTKKRKQAADELTSCHEGLTSEVSIDAVTCNSGELLPRRKRMKKKLEKESLKLLNCQRCSRTFCESKTIFIREETKSFFILSWMEQYLPIYDRENQYHCYSIPIASIQEGSLIALESSALNSYWSDEDQACYKIHQCANCKKSVAFQVVSDASLRNKLLIPSSVVEQFDGSHSSVGFPPV